MGHAGLLRNGGQIDEIQAISSYFGRCHVKNSWHLNAFAETDIELSGPAPRVQSHHDLAWYGHPFTRQQGRRRAAGTAGGVIALDKYVIMGPTNRLDEASGLSGIQPAIQEDDTVAAFGPFLSSFLGEKRKQA